MDGVAVNDLGDEAQVPRLDVDAELLGHLATQGVGQRLPVEDPSTGQRDDLGFLPTLAVHDQAVIDPEQRTHLDLHAPEAITAPAGGLEAARGRPSP